jgi:hypothetical protein
VACWPVVRKPFQEECTHCDKVQAWANFMQVRAIAAAKATGWESADGRTQIVQIVLLGNRVNDLLTELHGGPSGSHLGFNKTLHKLWQRYYWLQARNDVEKCRQCDTCPANRGPRIGNRGQMHQYNIGVPHERIAIDVTGPFPLSDGSTIGAT